MIDKNKKIVDAKNSLIIVKKALNKAFAGQSLKRTVGNKTYLYRDGEIYLLEGEFPLRLTVPAMAKYSVDPAELKQAFETELKEALADFVPEAVTQLHERLTKAQAEFEDLQKIAGEHGYRPMIPRNGSWKFIRMVSTKVDETTVANTDNTGGDQQ